MEDTQALNTQLVDGTKAKIVGNIEGHAGIEEPSYIVAAVLGLQILVSVGMVGQARAKECKPRGKDA